MITFNELVQSVGKIITPDEEKSQKIINNIRKKIFQYITNNNIQSLVVGVSGGLDSACVAALCQEKYTGVPLIGISIPMSSSNQHREQAKWVGNEFCSVFEEFNEWDEEFFENGEAEAYDDSTNRLQQILNTVEMTNRIAKKAGFNTKSFPKSVLDGNIKARLRMITLYDLARKTNGMVLSTDNLSEFQMGFWTICGDVGDVGPIQNIGKGFELPAIAKVLGIREDIISQPPSDGLMVTEENTDEAQLGANYQEVDTIMAIYNNMLPISDEEKNYFKKQFLALQMEENKISKIIQRYKQVSYKRNGTVNLTRQEIGI